MKLAVAAAASVASLTTASILTQNVQLWQTGTFDLAAGTTGGFVPTTGLAVSGESGWHTHGSGEDKDYDIDLAIILTSTEPISTSITTMIAMMMPMGV